MSTYNFHHVALSVGSLETSLPFYATFGFREVFRWASEDGSLTICHLGLKYGQPLIELFCYREPHSPSTSHEILERDLKQLGLRHFALAVPSVTAAYSDLQAAGLSPYNQIQAGRTGVSYFFVRDPDGNFVEIVQDDRELLSE